MRMRIQAVAGHRKNAKDSNKKKPKPNKTRACVKSVEAKFGNDQILDMTHFDEVGRRIRWSKNEFSHRLTPEPTAVGAVSNPRRFASCCVIGPPWLSYCR